MEGTMSRSARLAPAPLPQHLEASEGRRFGPGGAPEPHREHRQSGGQNHQAVALQPVEVVDPIARHLARLGGGDVRLRANPSGGTIATARMRVEVS
jgi:hypothetical protein